MYLCKHPSFLPSTDPQIHASSHLSLYPSIQYIAQDAGTEKSRKEIHTLLFIKAVKYTTSHAVSGKKKPKPKSAKEGETGQSLKLGKDSMNNVQ